MMAIPVSVVDYLRLCAAAIRTHWLKMLAPVFVVIALQMFVRLDVNYTDSLRHHVYLTVKGNQWQFQRGDYAAFGFPTENPISPFRKGDHLVKIVAGVPGDRVEVAPDGTVRIFSGSDAISMLGGAPAGIAKPYSKSGRQLKAFAGGTIPPGSYYMYSPHPDSLDSRYEMVGLIDSTNILGKTYPLF